MCLCLTEPFREAVDWRSLGLYDYPQVVKQPMDLGTVKKKIENGSYSLVQDCANDIRLIWKNCMTYNADGSEFYLLAEGFGECSCSNLDLNSHDYNTVFFMIPVANCLL